MRYQQTDDRRQVKPKAPPANLNLTDAARRGELLTLSLRYKRAGGERERDASIHLAAKAASFARASRDFQFASSVALFGMLLRQSPHAGDGSFAAVEEIADGNLGEDAEGYRHEFLELVRTARDLTAFGE